jgi:p-hydroxybenzoate 3-monooxygenase
MGQFKTQVGIVGAGPAGLMLSHLLYLKGIHSIVLEAKPRAYCEERVRAGVLEHTSVQMLRQAGLGERLEREGLRHEGIEIGLHGVRHRIPFVELTGKCVTVYGQQEVVKDLIAQRLANSGDLRFECGDVSLKEVATGKPRIRLDREGHVDEIRCEYIAGCDGFHGICRGVFPEGVLNIYERVYPFAWLGILAEAAPSREELVYMHHPRGFSLYSMRSPRITRLYLQCAPDEDLAQWSDGIWNELQTRLSCTDGWGPTEGRVLQKGVTGMRSFVAEPLQFGRLFLAGDAAHIVPPTGAKGMNLAFANVHHLAEALGSFLLRWERAQAGKLLGDLPTPHLEGAALLVVDDVAAAPVRERAGIRPQTSTCGAGVRDDLARCRYFACGELCGVSARGLGGVHERGAGRGRSNGELRGTLDHSAR